MRHDALTMDLAGKALQVFLHLDRHLNTLGVDLGGWLYGLLFLIVFCETGLAVTSSSRSA